MRWLLLCVLAVLMAASVHAATLTGTVYDLSLESIRDAIVEIDTKPAQRMVSRDGTYTFDVPPGSYELVASVKEDGLAVMGTREQITVEGVGEYTFDLFLYEDFSEEDDLLKMGAFDVDEDLFDSKAPPYLIFIFVFGVALIVGAILYLLLRSKQEGEEGAVTMQAPIGEHEEQNGAREEIVAILRANDGRMTQKELRRKLAHSEAKVSLLLAELESEGRIKKIKKGRGNILILQ